jgi:hypothetical protein
LVIAFFNQQIDHLRSVFQVERHVIYLQDHFVVLSKDVD